MSYPGESMHDIALLGLGLPKVMEAPWTSHTPMKKESSRREEDLMAQSCKRQWPCVCLKTKTRKGDEIQLNVYSLSTQKHVEATVTVNTLWMAHIVPIWTRANRQATWDKTTSQLRTNTGQDTYILQYPEHWLYPDKGCHHSPIPRFDF